MNMLIGNPLGGGLGKLGGGDDGGGDGDKGGGPEDPEVIQARIEAEERRQEKHRKMEKEREKIRSGIRDKYNIKKKDDFPDLLDDFGPKKEEPPDDSLFGKMGVGGDKAEAAKEAVGGMVDKIKGFLPFGK